MHTLVNSIAVKKYDKNEVFGTSKNDCNSNFVNVFSKCTQIYTKYINQLYFYFNPKVSKLLSNFSNNSFPITIISFLHG